MIDLYAAVRTSVENAIRSIVPEAPETIPFEYPPNAELGDLATPVALGLARVLKKAPRAIAEQLVEGIRQLDEVESADVAGPGYINVRIDRNRALDELLDMQARASSSPSDDKVIVEHTNINPNKAAHIGHLRNAVLGDTLVRSLRALGENVEVQNYIDDTGVQVADVVVAFVEMESMSIEQVDAFIDEAAARVERGDYGLDYDLWTLYARVTQWYEQDDSRLEARTKTLHALEAGEGETARIGARIARHVVRAHLRTMARLEIDYQILPKESDILGHRFWAAAFERLKQTEAISLSDSGKTAGCWVMNLPHDEKETEEETDGQEYEKVIVRSNGVVTYVGKDIAYQLWKFGLLGSDFEYRPFRGSPKDREDVWETAPKGEGQSDHPAFGRGQRVYNVIDQRQSYLQRVVKQGLERLGHVEQAEQSIHFSYEMVALSPQTARILQPDLQLTEEQMSRNWLDMSGRKGLGVKADDLLDRLEQKALTEVRQRNEDLPEEAQTQLAREIARGALRFYMLRYTRNKIVAFDIDDALAFEGETGPYCQYAAVRIARIVDKLCDQSSMTHDQLRTACREASFSDLPDDVSLEHWSLLQHAAKLPSSVRSSVKNLELSGIARFAFELSQEINGFYHKFPVVKEADEKVRIARLAVLLAADRALRNALSLVGVPVPERM